MKLSRIFWWSSKIFAIVLFFFWGAFFIEHLSEWFINPSGGFPPMNVWILQSLHFFMTVGFLIMLKWEKTGITIMLLSTILFFSLAGFNRFPFIAFINIIPVILFVISGGVKNNQKKFA